ncbi:MAG TPA: sensor domain-containing diguanylate cyclase [Solirubrobacteraceae bacterium]|nr:sensor domain-containing diguanylate cyclase [Solirubrobacteraceae bacterium]
MGQEVPHEHLLAIIEAQNEIAGSALELDAVLALVVRRAQGLTRADGALLELSEGQDLTCPAASGTAESLLGMRVPSAGGLSSLCQQKGEIVHCRDAQADGRVKQAACRQMNVVSLLSVPVWQGSRVAGALTVTAGVAGAFHYADERALDLLAGMIAAHLTRSVAADRAGRESLYDELTGLQNRRAFEQRLGAEVARVRRHGGVLALCLLDLDEFQEINDTLGHAVGDEVLRGVARRLEQVRGEDTAFRVGGDKFAVIFPDTGVAGARTAAERLETAVLSDADCGGVEASWGVAELAGGDPAELVAAAEADLRDNKRARRRTRDSY